MSPVRPPILDILRHTTVRKFAWQEHIPSLVCSPGSRLSRPNRPQQHPEDVRFCSSTVSLLSTDIDGQRRISCAFAVVFWRTFRGTTTAILGFFSIQEIMKISTSTGPLVIPSLLKKQPYFGDPITVLYYFSPTFCFDVHLLHIWLCQRRYLLSHVSRPALIYERQIALERPTFA